MGCTATYRRLRDGIRDFYRRNYPLTDGARGREHLNPGDGLVSRLCHEPRVALAVLEAMLAPYRSGRRLRVLLGHRPVGAESDGDLIRAVTLLDEASGELLTVHASYVLDATEFGDLLELAGIEHTVGAESQDETGEPHALPGVPNPWDQQAVSWCFPLDYIPDEDHTIDQPDEYDFWRDYRASFWPGPQLSWTDPSPIPCGLVTARSFTKCRSSRGATAPTSGTTGAYSPARTSRGACSIPTSPWSTGHR